MPHDRRADAVAADVIGVVFALRRPVGVDQSHEALAGAGHAGILTSIVAVVALYLGREAEEFSVVLLKPFEVRLDRAGNFLRILDREEMPDDLAVMLGLARKAKRGILLLLISASAIT